MTDHSLAVQKAVLDALVAASLAGGRVYDKPPADPYGDGTTYISFGPSDQSEDDADCIDGSIVTQQLDIWSRYSAGFRDSKILAGDVRSALHRQTLPISGAQLVELEVRSIRHLRDPDGITSHAVIEVRALVESE